MEGEIWNTWLMYIWRWLTLLIRAAPLNAEQEDEQRVIKLFESAADAGIRLSQCSLSWQTLASVLTKQQNQLSSPSSKARCAEGLGVLKGLACWKMPASSSASVLPETVRFSVFLRMHASADEMQLLPLALST
eukprot:792928-Pelagomonas_calceolata.AAC.2